jgi:hypothetical protein
VLLRGLWLKGDGLFCVGVGCDFGIYTGCVDCAVMWSVDTGCVDCVVMWYVDTGCVYCTVMWSDKGVTL